MEDNPLSGWISASTDDDSIERVRAAISLKLTINNAESSRYMLNVRRVASYHSNVKVVQELCRNKISSTAADRLSEGAARYNLSRTSLPSKRRSNLFETHYDR